MNYLRLRKSQSFWNRSRAELACRYRKRQRAAKKGQSRSEKLRVKLEVFLKYEKRGHFAVPALLFSRFFN